MYMPISHAPARGSVVRGSRCSQATRHRGRGGFSRDSTAARNDPDIYIAAQINQGTVLAVGPGRRTSTGELIPVGVKAGDKVLLPEYGGTPVKLEDTE